MYNPKFSTSLDMSIDMCLNMARPASSPTRNPMDLTSMLNPVATSTSPEDEERRMSTYTCTDSQQSFDSSTQHMDIDDELPSSYPSPSTSSSSSSSDASEPHEMSLDEFQYSALPPMRLNPHDVESFFETSHLIDNLSTRCQQDMPRFQHSESDFHNLALPFRAGSRPAFARHLPTRRHTDLDLARPSQHSRSRSSSRRDLYRPDHPSEGPRCLVAAQRSHRHRPLSLTEKKVRKAPCAGNNRPYTQEQLHWLRYFNEDCGLKYADMYKLWVVTFTAKEDTRGPKQNFSSRRYRDDEVPMAKANGELVRGENGKPLWQVCKKRARNQPAQKDIPFKLWERYPEWAVYWPWVQPQHKALAQKILDGNLDAVQQRKERYRIAIRNLAIEVPLKKGWHATPADHQRALSLSQGTAASAPTPSASASSSMSPEWIAPLPCGAVVKTDQNAFTTSTALPICQPQTDRLPKIDCLPKTDWNSPTGFPAGIKIEAAIKTETTHQNNFGSN